MPGASPRDELEQVARTDLRREVQIERARATSAGFESVRPPAVSRRAPSSALSVVFARVASGCTFDSASAFFRIEYSTTWAASWRLLRVVPSLARSGTSAAARVELVPGPRKSVPARACSSAGFHLAPASRAIPCIPGLSGIVLHRRPEVRATAGRSQSMVTGGVRSPSCWTDEPDAIRPGTGPALPPGHEPCPTERRDSHRVTVRLRTADPSTAG
jgi:hypothetical protein